MQAKDIMQHCETPLHNGVPAASAVQLLRELQINAVPVINDDNELIGAVTLESLILNQQFNEDAPIDNFLVRAKLIKDSIPVEKLYQNTNYDVFVVYKRKIRGVITKTQVKQYMCDYLAAQNKTLLNTLDSSHYAIVSIDANENVTFLNKAAEKILRTKRSTSIGRHCSRIMNTKGLLYVLKTGKPQLNYEYTTKYFDSEKTFIAHRTPIIENQKIIGAVSVFQSIDELDSISHKLKAFQQLNKELEALIEASYDGILIANSAGIILRANRAYWRLIGGNNDTLVKVPDSARLNGLQKELIASVIAHKGIVNSTINTGHNQLLLTGSPVLDNEGNLIRIVINIRDLTELNSLRLQLAKSQELTRRYHTQVTDLEKKLLKTKGLVIQSLPMRRLLDLALRVAQVDSTVLILGESGVGKGVLAQLIHENSKRSQYPFIKVNCGAIPESLLESELFGYEPGAFTGASKKGHIGMFEMANNGTILLDEIGDLPLSLQVKLLRVIQDKEIIRIGGNKPRQINVRILAATNKNLREMVEKGTFREDLFFRLNVIPLTIPPLRERKDEIVSLTETFVQKFCKAYGFKKELSQEVIDYFLDYDWPGNVRELENMVERILVTAPGKKVTLDDLNLQFQRDSNINHPIIVKNLIPLKKAIAELERQLINKAIKECGSTHKAAKALDVNQSTIVRKIQKYGST
ncbi:sigma 54-interacting transcriptional regulator [Desulfallas sp. Bu1-1]|uniref:sigma 54-interacting transcriptional regulator n=1 Tax=Desulfallas sp. Bu1-1 TaxID=2787620 RepID=UPI0018A0B7F7|nr:sigma 54-interacting transcriptional regulator [Desulfallas sp. Bu1-1]MBF7083666.1 sigma 54-interacting transcriptional regulator [Desulfallas sp. Bu1-1]